MCSGEWENTDLTCPPFMGYRLYRMHSTSLDLLVFLAIMTSLKNKVPVDISYSGEKSESGGHLRETTKEFF